MKTILLLTLAVCCIAFFSGSDWLSFRGSQGSSVSPATNLPVEISDTENLAWKIELPGRGPSSPIVVGDKVIVTCSGGDKQDQLYVVCVDAKSGEKQWQRRFWATGRCFCHPLSANAAPTPASDGKLVFAFFSSNDLVCLDLDGNLKWFRGLAIDHPKAGHDTGMSSSPAVRDGIVVCQVENQGDSFATGIDTQTGKTIWEIPRDKEAAWASPIIFDVGQGQTGCLLQAGAGATVVDLKTGKTIWQMEGRGNPIPSASVVGNRLYLPINGTTAVDFDADGSFNQVWSSSRVAAATSSNIVFQNKIYSVGRGGVVSCADATNGERIWQARVGGQHWTTPLIAGNHMYLFAQDGNASVIRLDGDVEDAKQRVVHQSQFADQVFLASPAASDDGIYMRSDKFLYKFAKDPI